MLADLLEPCLKKTGHFRGKGRFLQWWLKLVAGEGLRKRVFPEGGCLHCDMAVPYEAMIWLEREEEEDLAVLRTLLQPSETFVDCGANVGLWTVVAAARVGRAGRVYAFEPNPGTRSKLTRNVQESQLDNVTIVPAAVGDQTSTVLLKCETAHNISRVVTEEAGAIEVPIVTLDSQLNGRKVHGCKIDVEGFELNVLQGARRLLTECRPWLVVEFNTILAATKILGDWPVHRFLTGQGYVARTFANALNPSSSALLSDGWQTDFYCNLFYSPAASSTLNLSRPKN
jgi:FkbM family methyltransferase